jgi:hypothetical protein
VSIDIENGRLPVDETSRQLFCNLVASYGELIEKVLPTFRYDMDEGWKKGLHVKIIEDNICVET